MSAAPRLLHRHADAMTWCTAIVQAIRDALPTHTPGRLLLSGGNTPAPVYRALARQPLHWPQLAIGLVDERWLPDGDANRNDTLVSQHLLAHQPAAEFQPLARPRRGLDGSVATANIWWQRSHAPTVAILGMGNDSHTASLFPGAADLPAIAASRDAYAALDATGCAGAQAWPQRLTLTPTGLAACQHRLLLLRGQDKWETLQAALRHGDPARHPVLHALAGPTPLQVHWCA